MFLRLLVMPLLFIFYACSSQDDTTNTMYNEAIEQYHTTADISSIPTGTNAQEVLNFAVIKDVLEAITISELKDSQNSKSDSLFAQAKASVDQIDNLSLKLWVYSEIGFYYYSYNQYEEAVIYFSYTARYLDLPTTKLEIQPQQVCKKNAYFYQTLGEYEQSTRYIRKCKQNTLKTDKYYGAALNTIAINYLKSDHFEEAENYFLKAKEVAILNNDSLRHAKVLGELARVYIHKEQYDIAESLLHEDIAISALLKEYRNMMYAQLALGTMYLNKKDLAHAKHYLLKAEQYAGTKHYLKSYLLTSKQQLLKIAVLEHNEQQELIYRRAIDKLQEKLSDTESEEVIQNINLSAQQERITWELEVQNSKLETANYQRLIWTLGALFSLLIASLVFVLYRRRLNLQAAIYESRVLSFQLQKTKSEEKLTKTHNTLASYQVYLTEKNEQITNLEHEMAHVRQSTNELLKQKKPMLEEMLQSHLITDENWSMFKYTFSVEQPAYYDYLNLHFPNLTDSNLRIILLQKMNLTNLETATILGVTIDAVKKAKQRLKKKYGDAYDELFTM